MVPESGLAPGLYLVATPIGNLADITLRALAVLRGVDRIFCEDTRVTSKLLARYGISTPRAIYHDHNAEGVRPAILAALGQAERDGRGAVTLNGRMIDAASIRQARQLLAKARA